MPSVPGSDISINGRRRRNHVIDDYIEQNALEDDLQSVFSHVSLASNLGIPNLTQLLMQVLPQLQPLPQVCRLSQPLPHVCRLPSPRGR